MELFSEIILLAAGRSRVPALTVLPPRPWLSCGPHGLWGGSCEQRSKGAWSQQDLYRFWARLGVEASLWGVVGVLAGWGALSN